MARSSRDGTAWHEGRDAGVPARAASAAGATTSAPATWRGVAAHAQPSLLVGRQRHEDVGRDAAFAPAPCAATTKFPGFVPKVVSIEMFVCVDAIPGSTTYSACS